MIKKASATGICVNAFLAAAKIITGAAFSSLAILSDGINNLSDSMSSVVTLIGIKASHRKPTKAHPMGYGRIEYLSSLFVAFFVMMTGFSFLAESISSFHECDRICLSTGALILLASTVLAKLALFFFYRKTASSCNSLALRALASDSIADVLTTSLTIVSSLLSPYTDFPVDAAAGTVISILIIWNGFRSVLETSDTIIGKRPAKDEIRKIREIIREYPPLRGGYDIRIHNYGPELRAGTIDVEVPFSTTAEEISEAMKKAKDRLYEETGTVFTFGMNAENQDDERVREMMEKTLRCLKMASDDVIGIHGFHVHFDEKRIEFDVVVSFSLHDWKKFRSNVTGILELIFPDYTVSFDIDPDYS